MLFAWQAQYLERAGRLAGRLGALGPRLLFAWQAQSLETLWLPFAWQAQYLETFWVLFAWQAQYLERAGRLAGRLGALGPRLLFAWQAQYLETLWLLFAWQAQYLETLWLLFAWQVQHSEGASKLAGRLGALGPRLLLRGRRSTWRLSGCSLRGRCSTQREPANSLDAWALSVRGCSLRGRRSTWSVAGAVLGDSVAALCVAGAALRGSHQTCWTPGRSRSAAALCVAGALLGDSVAALCVAGAVLGDSVAALCVAGAVLREGRPTRWTPGRSRSAAALCVAGAVLWRLCGCSLRGRRSTWRLCGCSLRGRCSTQREPANLLDAWALSVRGCSLRGRRSTWRFCGCSLRGRCSTQRERANSLDAWATQLAAKFKEGDLIAIAGGTVISASQPYSTSKLLYYLRLKGTLGIQVQIANVDKVPWNLPGFLHPLVPLASLARVRDRQQICVAAVVVENPGSVERQASNGMASVCNAIVQAGNVRVRCAFWREHAEKLAAVELNSAILLYQVLVSKRKQDQDSWELSSWRGTQIVSCPQDHADKLCPGYNFFTSSSFSRYSLFFGCFTCYLFL